MCLYPDGMSAALRSRDLEESGQYAPLKFSSLVDRDGTDYVGVMPVVEWESHVEEGAFLVGECERLYQAFVKFGHCL